MSQENHIWKSGSNVPVQVTDRLTSVGSLIPDRFHARGRIYEVSTKRLWPSGSVQTSGPWKLDFSLFLQSFNGLYEQFYYQLLSSKFLKPVAIITNLFLCLFPLPSLTGSFYFFDLHLFCSKHKQFCKLQKNYSNEAHLPSWQNIWIQCHAKWETVLSLVVKIYIW